MGYKEPNLGAQLAYRADHPEKFTRREMAAILAEAAEVIGILRSLVDMRADIDLKDIEPEGNA